jgi:hypothetical protein
MLGPIVRDILIAGAVTIVVMLFFCALVYMTGPEQDL